MKPAQAAAPITKLVLYSMSFTENTRPRNSSVVSCCKIVVVEIAMPCATTPRMNPIATYSGWPNVSPSVPVTTPPTASMAVTQPALDIRLVATGVSQAAAP